MILITLNALLLLSQLILTITNGVSTTTIPIFYILIFTDEKIDTK